MFNFGKNSRYSTYESESYLHRGKNFTNLVSSKKYEDYIKNTLPNLDFRVSMIPAGLEGRPDLISYASYGTVNYWWLICEANKIKDPFEELYSGKQIKIPII